MMQISYPLFLVPLESGFVSVVSQGEDGSGEETFYLAVFTDQQQAAAFIEECGIEANPRNIDNSREFAWLLQSLRDPVLHVAFDPEAGSRQVAARRKVAVKELLEKHIVVDYSPWNYPVYVIREADGYSSIEGTASDGRSVRAINFFTSREEAEAYFEQCLTNGAVEALQNMQQTRALLLGVIHDVSAVALNPVRQEQNHSAEYCFSLQTILDKYLVEDTPDSQ